LIASAYHIRDTLLMMQFCYIAPAASMGRRDLVACIEPSPRRCVHVLVAVAACSYSVISDVLIDAAVFSERGR